MAYLIFTLGGEEVDRRELQSSLVIGRSAECAVRLHDILLSRRHCQFELADGQWFICDLQSKNGTLIEQKPITRQPLTGGETITVGKTRIAFHAGSFIPKPRTFSRPRPADPVEALDGTVAGMEYVEPQPEPPAWSSRLPKPQPRPRDPASFERDDLYSMLSEIASSSWDSIYETNARPTRSKRPTPEPMVRLANGFQAHPVRLRARRPAVCMDLQVLPSALTEPMSVLDEIADALPLRRYRRPDHRKVVARLRRMRLRRVGRWVTKVGLTRLF